MYTRTQGRGHNDHSYMRMLKFSPLIWTFVRISDPPALGHSSSKHDTADENEDNCKLEKINMTCASYTQKMYSMVQHTYICHRRILKTEYSITLHIAWSFFFCCKSGFEDRICYRRQGSRGRRRRGWWLDTPGDPRRCAPMMTSQRAAGRLVPVPGRRGSG